MASKAFQKMMAGLEDAIAYAEGDTSRGKVHKVKIVDVDVSKVRARVKLSQVAFARAFGISKKTLQNWEQRRRKPQGPAKVLLQIFDREPEAALRAVTAK